MNADDWVALCICLAAGMWFIGLTGRRRQEAVIAEADRNPEGGAFRGRD